MTCCPGHGSKEGPARPRPARDYAARLAGDVKKALTGAKKAEAAAAEAAAKVREEHTAPHVVPPWYPLSQSALSAVFCCNSAPRGLMFGSTSKLPPAGNGGGGSCRGGKGSGHPVGAGCVCGVSLHQDCAVPVPVLLHAAHVFCLPGQSSVLGPSY